MCSSDLVTRQHATARLPPKRVEMSREWHPLPSATRTAGQLMHLTEPFVAELDLAKLAAATRPPP